MTNAEKTNPWKILIVDDDIDIHDVTEMALKRLIYQDKHLMFIHAYSVAEAIAMLIEHSDIAVALIDVVMENDDSGLELVKIIREKMENNNIRIVIRTGNPGLAPEDSVTMNYDINDYRGKTELSAQNLRTIIITALRSYNALVTITGLKQELDDTQKELIYSLGEIAESRSSENGHHVKRVGHMSALLASKLGYSGRDIETIHLAASIHDIGKLGIDEKILNKPGKLTYDEFEIMKNHCIYGYDMLKNTNRDLLKVAGTIAYEHHENFDGSGYPRHLKGEEINLFSRIVALIDVFDALSTKRVYKEAWPMDEIMKYIESQRGIKFDPKIVDMFFENKNEILDVFNRISAE